MPKWLRALIAGYGAKKLGGGCFSTILIFVIIYYALGQCNHPVQHGSILPVPNSPLTDTSIHSPLSQLISTTTYIQRPGPGLGHP